MKTAKRITSLLLAVALAFSLAASCFADDTALTRQEAAEMLVQAADDYHRGVKTEDILKGYPDGNLDLRGTLTRAQALVMLDRAFGGLPAPVGDHARTAAGMQGFSDAPVWGGEELSRVLSSGIVAGEADGLLHPDAPVTRENLQTLLSRVYALEGTNCKDDFYETVNKTWLDSSDIPAGLSVNGPFYGLSLTVTEQVAKLISDIAAKPQTPGTPEAKIKAWSRMETTMRMSRIKAQMTSPSPTGGKSSLGQRTSSATAWVISRSLSGSRRKNTGVIP